MTRSSAGALKKRNGLKSLCYPWWPPKPLTPGSVLDHWAAMVWLKERSSWHNGSMSMVEGSKIETVTMNNDFRARNPTLIKQWAASWMTYGSNSWWGPKCWQFGYWITSWMAETWRLVSNCVHSQSIRRLASTDTVVWLRDVQMFHTNVRLYQRHLIGAAR